MAYFQPCNEWCRYLEVMATWQMFVELAIPTAIFLIKDASVSFAHATPYKTGNVWFPQNPAHFSRISAIINQMLDECGSDIAGWMGPSLRNIFTCPRLNCLALRKAKNTSRNKGYKKGELTRSPFLFT